jgi:hypothetical protein
MLVLLQHRMSAGLSDSSNQLISTVVDVCRTAVQKLGDDGPKEMGESGEDADFTSSWSAPVRNQALVRRRLGNVLRAFGIELGPDGSSATSVFASGDPDSDSGSEEADTTRDFVEPANSAELEQYVLPTSCV